MIVEPIIRQITPVSNGGSVMQINSERFDEQFTGHSESTNSTAPEAAADRFVL